MRPSLRSLIVTGALLSCVGDRCSWRGRVSVNEAPDPPEGKVDAGSTTSACCEVDWPVDDADLARVAETFQSVVSEARRRRPQGPVSFGHLVASEDELQSLGSWAGLVGDCRRDPDACVALLVQGRGDCAWLVLLDEALDHDIRSEPAWSLDRDCDDRRGLWANWWRSNRERVVRR